MSYLKSLKTVERHFPYINKGPKKHQYIFNYGENRKILP